MSFERKSPGDVAQALAERSRSHVRKKLQAGSWRRETFTLSRPEARAKAREWFNQYPKAAYMTEVESWRELSDDRIEFTMRRLPTAD
jgi:hypothetical protein